MVGAARPLRDPDARPRDGRTGVGSKNGLAEHIADKSMLCLFDNFEQVVEAAPEIAALLASVPNLDVVVTSRERLRVRGEQTYPVRHSPRATAWRSSSRARAPSIPSFTRGEAVAELCLRLDELPLALELAAARTALFSPEQLLERLSQRLDLLKGERDADPRQQTLRATIEWSYDLLSEEEQRLFARLSVFAGGCSYEAAEQIADADPDTLQSLLDKSLAPQTRVGVGSRYWMLETIREYAAERLEESGEAGHVNDRHRDWFASLAEEADMSSRGGDRVWFDLLEAENDNARVALDTARRLGQTDVEVRLATHLWGFWAERGQVGEGVRVLEAALTGALISRPERFLVAATSEPCPPPATTRRFARRSKL